MYTLTSERLAEASRNAKRLFDDFQTQGISADKSNPCTTVYQLVELLEAMKTSGLAAYEK